MKEWSLDTDKEGFLASWKIVYTLNKLLKRVHQLFLLFFVESSGVLFFLPHEITRVKAFCFYAGFTPGNKGQLISKSAVFKSPKNQQFWIFLSLPLKRGQIKKSSVRESKKIQCFFLYDLFLEARAEILEIVSLVFWETLKAPKVHFETNWPLAAA